MSNTIVVDPQSNEQGASPQTTSPEPVNPLEFKIPKDFDGVDPTYRGKSLADIIEMQNNASRKIGEQANEIGSWRSLVTQLTETQASAQRSAEGEKTPAKLDITSEKLLDDPAGSIADVVERLLESKLDSYNQRLQRNETLTELQAFERDFPEAKTMGQNPEFLEWGSKSPTRLRKLQAASQGDLTAARELLEIWQDRQELVQQYTTTEEEPTRSSTKPQGVDGARRASTEPGGSGAAARQTYSASELVNMINTQPDKYRSPSFQAELQLAAKEGRITA
jgi:hypothetical protein